MKNISDYDDTSLGDYEMILRNQRGGVVKDPSILTASKSQNNQSMGSYNNSRFQNKSRVKNREQNLRFVSKHQTVVSKKSHYRHGGGAAFKNNMNFSKKRGKKKVQHASALGDKEIGDSSLQHQQPQLQNQTHHWLVKLPSEGASSTKQVLNNITGYTSSYAIN